MVASLQLNIHSGKGVGFCTKGEKNVSGFLKRDDQRCQRAQGFPLPQQRSQLLHSCRITSPSKAPKLYTCVLN